MKEELFECTLRKVAFIRVIKKKWNYADWRFKNGGHIIIGSELWNELENTYLNYCTQQEFEDEIQDLKNKLVYCETILNSNLTSSITKHEYELAKKEYEKELEMLLGNEDE